MGEVTGVRSVCIGLWVRSGSVLEKPEQNGYSHFIEHLLFKGTKTRSAEDIAREMDDIGAQQNAFTGKECTCYYAKVIDDKLPIAVDILADMYVNSVFDADEIEREKGVVLEEISMYNDTPDDVAHEQITELFFRGSPLEPSILGTEQKIKNANRTSLINYLNEHYTGQLVVCAIGGFDPDALEELLLEKFPDKFSDEKTIEPEYIIKPETKIMRVDRDIEQVHISLAMPGVLASDERRFALSLINNYYGASMSSKLFQRVREQMGAAYTIYSYHGLFKNAGMTGVYAATSPTTAQAVVDAIIDETQKLRKNGISQERAALLKDQVRGNYILAQESSSSKMSQMGKAVLLENRLMTDDEVLTRLAAVSADEIADSIAVTLIPEQIHAVFVGKASNTEKLRLLN